MARLPLFALPLLMATALPHGKAPPPGEEIRLCSMAPAPTLALLRVERDTTLPFAPARAEPMSLSSVRPSARDSLLAMPGTPMPAARVRLLRMDSTTREILAASGIADSQPAAFIRAAPYRADCKVVRWTDTVSFAERGEVGYARATLARPEQWIGDVPVFVIMDTWNYPYPRRRGLAFVAAPGAPLAPAEAMFDLSVTLEMPRTLSAEERIAAHSVKRTKALAWARANPDAAELEPARTVVRRAILDPDWRLAQRVPSRLRGTYRVDLELGGERSTWFFRTHDRPGYMWHGGDSLQTTADLLESPSVPGYGLVGYYSDSLDILPDAAPRGAARMPLVWLATADRPTTVENDARRALTGVLEFKMTAAPEWLWDDLETLVPRRSARDSALLAQLNRPIARGEKQPRFPLTVRLDSRGGVGADTTILVRGRPLRVVLERVDTLSMRRPF